MSLAVIVGFLVLLIIAIPISMSMVGASMIPVLAGSNIITLKSLLIDAFAGSDSTPILAVPLFILAGVIMSEGGISKKLFNVFAYIVGSIPGGLPCASIITALFYGAISGSGPATCAAVGTMAIPFLEELGYDKRFCAGMIATAGGLGVIIPPSIPFVLYSLATNVSTGNLFLAGVPAGLLIGFALMVWAVIYSVRKGEDRTKIKARMKELHSENFFIVLIKSFWALLSPVIVLGGIYGGIFTPTEAACVSVFYSLIVSLFIYRSISVKDVWPMFKNAVASYAPLCFVISYATAFGRVLTRLRAAQLVSDFITGNFSSAVPALLAVVVIMFLLGMVMDVGPAILILAPILLPAMQAMGVNDVHFGVIMVIMLAVGQATPPFGLNLFVAGTISDLKPMTVARFAAPFVVFFTVAALLITLIPGICLFLL